MPKIKRKLTEKEIISAKPKDKPYRLHDDRALSVLVRETGTKVWQYRYHILGKANVYTIGKVGEITTAEARQRRDEARKLVDQGIDPNYERREKVRAKAQETVNTFEAIAQEWIKKQTWAPKHGKNVRSRLEKDVMAEIGHKPIKDVTIPDVLAVLRKIEARGALDVAKRINHYMVAIFEYAILLNLTNHNPAIGRAKFIKSRPVQHRPHLKEDELPDFLKRLDREPDSIIVLAVKLLMLTFVRPGELRGARWDEFDLEKGIWSIPAHRMKISREHMVPLSRQALDVIAKIPRSKRSPDILFPGQKANTPYTDVALIKAVTKLTEGKARPHGFRHTASTILNERGYNSQHIEMQLAHVDDNKVRGTYNKALYLEQRKVMMQDWADYLDRMKKYRTKNGSKLES